LLSEEYGQLEENGFHLSYAAVTAWRWVNMTHLNTSLDAFENVQRVVAKGAIKLNRCLKFSH